MSLVAGTRLGVYEIGGTLGAGAMGVVYRARDTRLGRDVAVKVLPAHFAGNPSRLARFEREARMLAALNHPNIPNVLGVEDAAPTAAIIMELAAGRPREVLDDKGGTFGLDVGPDGRVLALTRSTPPPPVTRLHFLSSR